MNLEWAIRAGHPETKEPGYRIKFEYRREVVENLKSNIPHLHRVWEEETKTWWVAKDYENTLAALFGNFGPIIFQQGELF